jgi:hypothetical protein
VSKLWGIVSTVAFVFILMACATRSRHLVDYVDIQKLNDACRSVEDLDQWWSEEWRSHELIPDKCLSSYSAAVRALEVEYNDALFVAMSNLVTQEDYYPLLGASGPRCSLVEIGRRYADEIPLADKRLRHLSRELLVVFGRGDDYRPNAEIYHYPYECSDATTKLFRNMMVIGGTDARR